MSKADTQTPLVLVDGSSYLYRAFHIPNLQILKNAKGEPTGAIYGVLNMLRRLRSDYQPAEMVVVFDAKGKTFRHDLYPAYKANRPPMPDDLRQQIEPLHQAVRALGYPLLSIEGVEADDVIGSLARRAADTGRKVVISTGDKDLAQLVNAQIQLVNTMSNTVLDEQGVVEKFGVKPNQIIDYLALMGDSSDNIPGVEKVGPKTAAKWLQEYGTLDELLAHADDIGGKVGENLRAVVTQLPLSKQLTTIDCNVELDISMDELAIQPPQTRQLRDIFKQLEFRSWLEEIGSDVAEKKAVAEVNYEIILDQKRFDHWIKCLQTAEIFAFDTETTSLNYMQAEIVGISFALKEGEAAYVPFAHQYENAPQQLPRDKVLQTLKPLLESGRRIIAQHAKYDRNVLLSCGIQLEAIAHDTMLESYVLDSTASRHDMDSLAKKYLDVDTVHFEDIAGKGVKQLRFDQIDIETAGHYAAEDADITFRLHQVLWPKLQQSHAQASVYTDIELPLIKVLSRMERNGVKVDADKLNQLSRDFAQQMQQVEVEAFALADGEFNLASPKQIQEILFERQNIPVIRKTPKGQPSTAEDVLQELAEKGYELPAVILRHRMLSKLKSTYTDKLPLLIDPGTGRVHTSYHQAVTATGRLSSADPNLQNIPIRNEEGREIRKAFVAGKSNCLIAADYSQIELRIMAHLSGDKGLLTAFEKGADIHSATAAEVFGLALEAVTAEERRAAKAINFGLIYGMSAFGLANQLNTSRKQAQAYIDLYFDRYPGVKRYMDKTRQLAHEQGYVETVFGRRLYLPEIKSRNAQRRQYAERTAINAPMQGTAADIIKRAMIELDGWLLAEHPAALLIMQVHDELVLEVPKDQVQIIAQGVNKRMVEAAELTVPLEVVIGVGDNWDQAH
ncbi:MAG: DNA polymerase I [Gammaproteobacteria bacterium]|nr:DNA polymerase I [Gammaproteobacteria bacterium]